MKNHYLLILTLFVLLKSQAQIVNIPDANFKARLLQSNAQNGTAQNLSGQFFSVDANGDGEIQLAEAANVGSLLVSSFPYIQSLEGISSFANLKTLNCSAGNLTELNLSGLSQLTHLTCAYNQISNLDLTGLPALRQVRCNVNALTSINVSGLTNLDYLDCSMNQLPTLDISGLSGLLQAICRENNITSLNFAGATNLEHLDCIGNELTALDVTSLPHLDFLECSGNQLASLNVSGLQELITLNCCYNALTTLEISGLNQFANLYCYGNQLTSLNLSNLPLLRILQCNDNALATLEVTPFQNLYQLICGNNVLTALGLSGLNQLNHLDCSHNLLSNIDVTMLPTLQTFDCSFNQLTTLDVSNMQGLSNLNCSYNMLSSLNTTNTGWMSNLYCRNNQLTGILDLTAYTYLNQLDCTNNNLTAILLKNGRNESVDFGGNDQLEFICADESQIEAVQFRIEMYGLTNCHVNSYCNFTPGGNFFRMQGQARYDENGNGCDGADIHFPNLKLNIASAANQTYLISNADGNYHYDVQAGTYNVSPVLENSPYFSVTPASVEIAFPDVSPYQQDFCIAANGTHADLEISLIPLNTLRPGFDSQYKIVCYNKGTVAQSGSVHLSFDDTVLDFVSSNPSVSSQSLNELVWDFNALAPFYADQFTVTFNANSPTEIPALNGGDLLNFTASIVSAQTDETPEDNTFTLQQNVVNSFDPNDKTCLQGATITPEMVGKYVHYLIRFENTGTANAENIVVKDMIDTAKFDVSSLIPLDGSHEFVTRINGNKVEFIFENINLPFDDANNDGYVAFKIKTKPTLVLGDTFSNTASIYFDYNFPIITEPAITAIAVLAKQDFVFDRYFRIYPNPASDVLKVESKQNIEIHSISIYNTLGQLVLVVPNAKATKAVDVSGLQTGNYFIRIQSDKGSSNAKFLKN